MQVNVVLNVRCKLQRDKDNPDMQANLEVDVKYKLQCDTYNPDMCRQTWKQMSDVSYGVIKIFHTYVMKRGSRYQM